MKITVENPPSIGIPLSEIPFGTVVARVGHGTFYYLVAASMDGTGRRILVKLDSGTTKLEIEQDTRVHPVDAELVIGGRRWPNGSGSGMQLSLSLHRKLEVARAHLERLHAAHPRGVWGGDLRKTLEETAP